jgi:DNA-directed RNA polymerase specialized sigma subunit
MEFAQINYRKMNETENTIVCQILAEINSILRKWKAIVPVRFRELRTNMFVRPHDISVPEDRKQELLDDAKKIASLRQVRADLGNRDIEQTVLEGFSGVANKTAHKWSRNEGNGLTIQDLLQECYFKIFEAMYQWNPESGGSLMTILFVSLDRHLTNVVNDQGSFFSSLNEASKKLLVSYNKAKRNTDDDSSEEEIIQTMNLSKDDALHLCDILRKAINATNMSVENSDVGGTDDYTSCRRPSNDVQHVQLVIENIYVKEILDRSDLNPIERELIEIAMEPHRGWQSEIVKKYVSPVTEKNVSKMRISQILERAKEKVALVMSRTNVRE